MQKKECEEEFVECLKQEEVQKKEKEVELMKIGLKRKRKYQTDNDSAI